MKKSAQTTLQFQRREWFYYIDHKGLLFLEETEPKNYTSCLKDDKFLNFFFSNLRPVTETKEEQIEGYPYLSPCWGELNYVKSFKCPIIFKHLTTEQGNSNLEKDILIYGGALKQEFHPDLLIQDEEGLLLHPLTEHKYMKYGALDMSLCQKIGVTLENDPNGCESFIWRDQKHLIRQCKIDCY
ncbi:hypothetical protein FGO68_gene7033 [Halteria grandinella]|uniref:Uncharacterized protein n=1 Tax=Halteria grandinella TaxID=5974 RepID=A0A8J8NWJ1_HALGN|nr:hypothetical protein FGO68_gene7033 [Halteria grandinella]